MNKKERALFIEKKLNELFPNPKAPLNHKNAFTFLIAVLLSAQTTDKRVNIVTKELFKISLLCRKHAEARRRKSLRFNKNLWTSSKKSQSNYCDIRNTFRKYNGKVPKDLAALEELPGVGHKTASVVVSEYFKIPAFL